MVIREWDVDKGMGRERGRGDDKGMGGDKGTE